MLTIPADNLTPIEIFEKLYNGYGSFLLESPNACGKLERFSFIGISPKKVIHSFDALIKADLHYGAFGFFSYDFGSEIEALPDIAEDDLKIPHLWFIIPETLIVFDHQKNVITIKSKRSEEIRARISGPYKNPLFQKWKEINLSEKIPHNKMIPYMHKDDFKKMVEKAKEYIAAGDIYQANLSQRFSTLITEHPFETYKQLRKINPSPFAAYLDCGAVHLVSCSPERLISLENNIAQTRPIAGTNPKNSTEDQLLLDKKERAEHIMLVDLERNDLGKVCEYGSVEVDEMMTVEHYSHVLHIVSNVWGRLREDKDKFDLIKAMFPGGTITGCPKIRAMQIIEELEPIKRNIYTGSIGYIMHNQIDLNIAIRTIVIKDHVAHIQVGAGIVADSDPEREYHETLYKAQAMFEALRATREPQCTPI
ncbi:MAG: anthranilate synthase component I family protein [Candidatus Saganbacteria bacterium]|nr:anthranilate synthase component I family protein [Candidatus Saganbacteria bacterium]